MYHLVNRIEDYPQFLPWCKSTHVLSRTPTEVTATIEISYSKLKKSFTTQNIMLADESIEMRLVKGPFKSLQGRWTFEALGDAGCKVVLNIEFEFSNALMRATLGPVFSKILNALVDSFTKRADEVYGKLHHNIRHHSH